MPPQPAARASALPLRARSIFCRRLGCSPAAVPPPPLARQAPLFCACGSRAARPPFCASPLQTSWMSPEEAAAQSNAAVSRLADAKMTEEGAKLLKRQLGEFVLRLGLREAGLYSGW